MKLQERFSTLSPIYSGGLTNHLPMMITALQLLDVEEDLIEVIAEEYLASKVIVDLSNSGIENDPFSDEYVRLTNFFLFEMKHKGIEQTMHNVLDANRFSLHSGLFHGLIRIAYAYLDGSELLIAQALAYFEIIKEELILKGKPSLYLKESFEVLVKSRREFELKEVGTSNKFNKILANQNIKDGLFHPKRSVNRKDKPLKFFLEYFNKTKDFYILHVITGYHALHILTQFFDNEEEVYNNFFMQALLVMLIHPHTGYIENIEQTSFIELTKKVPELRDAHDIKFFNSLCYFYERYEMDEARIAANLIFNT